MALLIIICAAAAGWGGWKIAMWLNKKEGETNAYLRNHIEEIKTASRYWYEQSNINREAQQNIINNHNYNLNQTLQIVLTILQKQNKENLREDEKIQVENIIKSIKGFNGISSSHVE